MRSHFQSSLLRAVSVDFGRRDFLKTGGSLLGSLACAGFSGLGYAAEKAAAEAGSQLREGDVVALCGDSITSGGVYPQFLEAYQIVCSPKPTLQMLNFGRSGEVAAGFPPIMDKEVLPTKPTVALICYGMNSCRSGKVMSEAGVQGCARDLKTVTDKFKKAGVRLIVLASPGCVDSTHFTLSQNAPVDPKAIEATQKNLAMFGSGASKLATQEGFVFADMHTPMVDVMAKAKQKYGKEYPFAGGAGDGVHPGQAGHLVMAWVYLKALGYDGNIGTLTLDLAKGEADSTAGHRVLSFKDGSATLESVRYPFCFLADPRQPKDFASANSTRSVVDFFPFNADLNRLTLIVRSGKAKKLKITWSSQAKEFEAEALEKGINLAAEFLDNPFSGPFGKIMAALSERNSCRGWLKQEAYKNDPSIPKRLEVALKALVPVPVKHEIKVEATS